MIGALVLGLGGSFHCLTMCGPIMIALPFSSKKNWNTVLAYHSGRLCSYGILGATGGIVGAGFSWAGWQQWIAIAFGTVFIFYGLQQWMQFDSPRLFIGFYQKVKHAVLSLYGHKRKKSVWALGMLNGLLPCGLVYVALGGAVVSGHPIHGFLYMMIFGAGTLPMMMGIHRIGMVKRKLQKPIFNRILPFITLLFGVWMLLKGLGMDIPYVSPASEQLQIQVGAQQSCDP